MKNLVKQAVEILNSGSVVGLPTETVYGLAARIDRPEGLKAIFHIKERPFFDPLIVHISSIENARSLVSWWPEAAQALAKHFWPGPLTLVLPKNEKIDSLITAGLETVGLRMPRHPLALEVIEKVGVPLAAPSANKFGKVSPTCAEHVKTEFAAEKVFILDGGPCEVGLESTVLLLQRGTPLQIAILREGAVLGSEISAVLREAGLSFQFLQIVDRRLAPGHVKHHYMPSVPLIICEESIQNIGILKERIQQELSHLPDEVEGVRLAKPKKVEKLVELVLSSDPVLAARELYARLRETAALDPDVIYFIKKSSQVGEAWGALNNRLEKAASLILSCQ